MMTEIPAPGYDLIVTNGDAAGELLRKAIGNTEVLPWRDVLHDGPVPLTDDHDELSEMRADFLADKGWGEHDALREAFRARDRGLAYNAMFERVVLWFEHDLYDQLQLLQVLDWFAGNPRGDDSLLLVQAGDFIGSQSLQTIPDLQALERPVAGDQLALARVAWNAFRQPTPREWAGLLERDLSALPFLEPAVKRMLEEFPDAGTGLSRTQAAILRLIDAEGVTQPGHLFGAAQREEEAAFMGDWSFWERIDALADPCAPLVEGLARRPFRPDWSEEEFGAYLASELGLTPLGRKVLAGEEDYLRHAPLEHWRGGTHQRNGHVWRWDRAREHLVPPS